MSTPQETRVITSRVIDSMSEHYRDIWADFLRSGERIHDAAVDDGAFGTLLGRVLGPAYDTAWRGCRQALQDGAIASVGISESLTTCAANWRAAEQAGIVEYR